MLPSLVENPRVEHGSTSSLLSEGSGRLSDTPARRWRCHAHLARSQAQRRLVALRTRGPEGWTSTPTGLHRTTTHASKTYRQTDNANHDTSLRHKQVLRRLTLTITRRSPDFPRKSHWESECDGWGAPVATERCHLSVGSGVGWMPDAGRPRTGVFLQRCERLPIACSGAVGWRRRVSTGIVRPSSLCLLAGIREDSIWGDQPYGDRPFDGVASLRSEDIRGHGGVGRL